MARRQRCFAGNRTFTRRIEMRYLVISISLMFFLTGCGNGIYKHYEKADKFLQQNRLQDAIIEYEEAIRKEPSNSILKYNLGVLYIKNNQIEKAFKVFDELYKQDPDLEKVKHILEFILLRQAVEAEKRNPDEAIKIYERLLHIQPKNYQARYSLAHLFASQNYRTKSIEQLKVLVNQLPQQDSLYFEIATFYLQDNNWKDAIKQLKEIQKNSLLFNTAQACLRAIYLTQAVLQESNENWDNAAQLYEEATRYGRFDAMLWNKLGQILYDLGKDAQAEKFFREVINQEPKNELAHFYLGLIIYNSEGLSTTKTYETKIQQGFDVKVYIGELAIDYNIPLEFILALMRQESNFVPNANNRNIAYGLMQLTRDTAREQGLTVNNEIDEREIPKRNIEAGARYLRYLLDIFDNNMADAAVAYNCGPGNVKNYNRWAEETKIHAYKVWHYYSKYVNSPEIMQQDLERLAKNCSGYDFPKTQVVVDSEEDFNIRALEHFQQCTNLPEANFNIAVIYDEMGESQEAIGAYQNSITQIPAENASQARLRIANNYLQIGDYEKAREMLVDLDDESAKKILAILELLSGKDMENSLKFLNEEPVLSVYALLSIAEFEKAEELLQSLQEDENIAPLNAVMDYFQELPSYRARQQSSWLELFMAQPNFKSAKNLKRNFIMPARGRISSKFGWRSNPFGGSGSEWHNGVDIAVPHNTPIKAIQAGIVICTDENNTAGKFIVLQHTDGYESNYCHLSRILVSPGDKVEQGEVIAYSGSTGRSTGPHLHLGIKRWGRYIDPLKLLRTR